MAIAQRSKTKIKRSASTDKILENYSIGQARAKNMIAFDSSDVQAAKDWCAKLGIDYKTYDSSPGSREERGTQQASEKGSSVAIYSKFVPVRAFGQVKLNNIPLGMPNCGFLLITPSEVTSITADCILLVENLETFTKQVDAIKDMLPLNCLVVFRGSRHFGGNTEKSVLKWRREYKLFVLSFYDYDIAGLIKQSERDWDQWILPNINELELSELTGNFEDLENQKKELNHKYRDIPLWLSNHVELFERKGGSFTQERLIGHGIKLEIVSPCSEVIV